MQRGQVVLVDTNIIIEAVRTHCWNALSTHFTLETVEKCLEESLTGDLRRKDYVQIDPAQLTMGLSTVHKLTTSEAAALLLMLPNADALDAGERHLWAHALGRSDAWLASCADRSALKAAFVLGWKDRFVSLEALAREAGARPDIKQHFREHWLLEERTAFLLDKGLT